MNLLLLLACDEASVKLDDSSTIPNESTPVEDFSAFTVDPTLLEFPVSFVGDTTQENVTVTNTGTITLS